MTGSSSKLLQIQGKWYRERKQKKSKTRGKKKIQKLFYILLKLSHTHIYFSGSSDDPHAGVAFAMPTPLLPIVYDFHPWNSRISVLILNTRLHRVALFSIYAPSTIQDTPLQTFTVNISSGISSIISLTTTNPNAFQS